MTEDQNFAAQLMQARTRIAMLEGQVANLGRVARNLTPLKTIEGGCVIIGPVGWGQLQEELEKTEGGRLPDIRHVLMAVQAGDISTGRANEIIRAIMSGGDYFLPAPSGENENRALAEMREGEAPTDTICRLLEQVEDLKCSVVAFGAIHAVRHAEMHQLPPGHIYAVHYDILKNAGARMDDFARYDPPKPQPQEDRAAEFLKAERGSLPGFDLDL